MSVWLTSFVFLAFGYGISSFQSGAKLFLSPMRTRPRIIVYLAIIAIFVILLPIMAALAQVDAIQVDWKQFALVAPINIVLLRCAYLIDVTHTVRLIAPLEEEDTVL